LPITEVYSILLWFLSWYSFIIFHYYGYTAQGYTSLCYSLQHVAINGCHVYAWKATIRCLL